MRLALVMNNASRVVKRRPLPGMLQALGHRSNDLLASYINNWSKNIPQFMSQSSNTGGGGHAGVERRNSKRQRTRGRGAASWTPAALTRFDRQFDVVEVSSCGDLRRTKVTMAEMLSQFGVHARDIISLGLQDQRYRPPPALLPRDGVVVVALGPFKALLHPTACLLFEADREDVAHAVPALVELMRENAKVPLDDTNASDDNSDDDGDSDGDARAMGHREGGSAGSEAIRAMDARGGGDGIDNTAFRTMFKEQDPMPFELAMLEAMLHEVCSGYHRRAHFVRRLMEEGLKPSKQYTSSLQVGQRIGSYRLVPLKLALKQLELKLSQTKDCLEDLIHSDEDMLGLLLTERMELGPLGKEIDPDRHSVVELLLESYHRQLVLVEHDLAALSQEIQSMQELAKISLDVSRNAMIAVDIRLAMVNVGIATSACIFGAFGMNLIHGLEESSLGFYGAVGGGITVAACVLATVLRHLRSVAYAGDSQRGELMALNSICDNVDSIEGVLRSNLDRGKTNGIGGREGGGGVRGLDREAMAASLSRARGKEISNQELDLIFDVFDTSGDGRIGIAEYGEMLADHAGSLRLRGLRGDHNRANGSYSQ